MKPETAMLVGRVIAEAMWRRIREIGARRQRDVPWERLADDERVTYAELAAGVMADVRRVAPTTAPARVRALAMALSARVWRMIDEEEAAAGRRPWGLTWDRANANQRTDWMAVAGYVVRALAAQRQGEVAA